MLLFIAAGASDFTTLSTDVIFTSGSTDNDVSCVNITILEDYVLEGYQTFTLTLTTSDSDVVLGTEKAMIIILDNDGS